MELTVLMPCLNEAETIVVCIQKAKLFLKRENVEGEILIADNGSTDGSQELALEEGARIVNVLERGYGAALSGGIRAAKGKYVIMGDADDSYDFSNLKPFVEKLRQDYELVMGNRFRGGIKPGAMPFLNRYLGNPVLSFVGRLFFRSSIGDFHCGLRGFHRSAIESLNLQTRGMEFASEMVVKATLKNLKITEVPISLFPDGRSRPPHLRKWRDGCRHLKFLLLFSPQWLFLCPGVVLSSIGFILMGILAISQIQCGRLSFGIHTMLFCGSFFIIGLQAIFFAAFGKLILAQKFELQLDARFDRFLRQFSFKKGIFFGVSMVTIGIVGSVGSLWIWASTKFGTLVPDQIMRITIPSIVFLIAGVQVIFSSFFMSFLAMESSSWKSSSHQ